MQKTDPARQLQIYTKIQVHAILEKYTSNIF